MQSVHVNITQFSSWSWPSAEEEEDEDEAQPKTKKETRWGWELLNDNKAIWLRSASDVEDEEYEKFYQALSKVCYPVCNSEACLMVSRQLQGFS